MKIVPLAALVLVLTPAATLEDALVYAPEQGSVLVRSFVSSGSYELDELSLTVDGEELDGIEAGELRVDSEETVVVTDTLLAVADGRPTELERTYDELSRSVVYSSGEGEEEEFGERSTSDLEGVTVRFAWDADEEEYVVELDEDGEVDEDLLEGLWEDMDLRDLLPPDEVDEDDSWEVDAGAYLTLMWPGGLVGFYPEEEGEIDEVSREVDQEMVDGLEGTASVTFRGVREEDGLRLGVLELELSVTSQAETTFDTEEGAEMDRTIEIEREVTGEVWWDLDAGRLHGAELTAEAVLTMTTSGVGQGPDGEIEIVETRRLEGTIEYETTVELAE